LREEKTPAGDHRGFHGQTIGIGGIRSSLTNKQQRAPTVHTPLSDFHNLSDHAAAIGSIRLGSLFLTLPTRVLTGQETMPSEG